ncbi:MAG: FGGY-family carbohydrate kinase [Liquorilactobacillus satsumensis]|uniref:FGGY-family carbohydrate kinase n=1 Tax=Liquorilactobacillus satsumensis TaxID=259059 RepID=UPI0039E9F5FC
MTYLILDIGTSSIRGILYDKWGTNIHNETIHYSPTYSSDGSVTQPASVFSELSISIIKKSVSFANNNSLEISCLSITSQRSSLIAVANGKPLLDTIMWQDTRVSKLLDHYRDYDYLFQQISGSILNPIYLGSKIFWVKHMSRDTYIKTDKMLNIPSYLTFLMTGEYNTDATYASRTNLMNIHTLKWDNDLFDILGLDIDKMPKIIMPGSICGKTTQDFQKLTGLKHGTPVVSAGGDQQCASLGSGLVLNDEVSVNTGTGGYLIKNLDKLPEILNKNIIYNVSAIPNKYILEIDLVACSSILNWFIKNFYTNEYDKYGKVNEDLDSVYGKPILMSVLPFHKGKSIGETDNSIRAGFTNIGLSSSKSDMLYALMSSLFLEINHGLGIFKSYGKISSIKITGGLTNSKTLNQLQADSYNLEVRQAENPESTALGSLISAAVSMKDYPSFSEAAESIITKKLTSYFPNESNVKHLQKFNEHNKQLYDLLKGTEAGFFKEKLYE